MSIENYPELQDKWQEYLKKENPPNTGKKNKKEVKTIYQIKKEILGARGKNEQK